MRIQVRSRKEAKQKVAEVVWAILMAVGGYFAYTALPQSTIEDIKSFLKGAAVIVAFYCLFINSWIRIRK